MDETRLIEAMRRPEAYATTGAEGVTDVGFLRTHVSLLFFAGDRVYKVKRAVDVGFLDATTLEARRHLCGEEVRLNRRLAPSVYLGVAALVRGRGNEVMVRGGADGDAGGVVIDYAVEMVRLPADRMMSALLETGGVSDADLEALAALLAGFHARCATGAGIDEHATADELGRQARDNLAIVRACPVRAMSEGLAAYLDAVGQGFLDTHAAVFARRIGEGRVREGHGDVHAGNICLTADGIVIYDCIEFSPRFRCRDVAAEVAYLAMDVDLRGHRDAARHLLASYARAADDDGVHSLAVFYKAHFACVRGMVAVMTAHGHPAGSEFRDASCREAMRYFHLAAGYTLPPSLVVMCGLPGTGKSFAARAIARPLDASVLRSDLIRKGLAGLDASDRPAPGAGLEDGIYTAAFTARTYAAIRAQAAEALASGRTVVVDATCATAAVRAEIMAVADDGGHRAIVVECTRDDATVRAHLAARTAAGTDASDADWAVYEHARASYEPPTAEGRCAVIDDDLSSEEIAARAIELLLPEG